MRYCRRCGRRAYYDVGGVKMKTEILSGAEAIRKGAELIGKGSVVAFPTETVYGLAANAYDEAAVAKVFEAKGRPGDNPLIVHLADKKDIADVTKGFDPKYNALINAFMPGPITLVVPKKENIPYCVTAGLETVGVRIPSSPVANAFIAACKVPIAAPSANLSTKISPTSAAHVYEDMNGRIPLIIDGGECNVGIESTVVDITGDIPVILRPGAVTAEMIAAVLNTDVKTHRGNVIAAAPAPGMKYKHYAPVCDCVVASDPDSAARCYEKAQSDGFNPIILCRRQNVEGYGSMRCMDMGGDDNEVCRNIYSGMHKAEKISDYIICEDFGDSGVAASVMNRVNKAAGGKRV